MTPRTVSLVILATIAAATVGELHAQYPDTAASPPTGSTVRAITLTGEIGAYGALYSMTGRDGRRPSSLGRIFFRPTLTFFDALSL